MRKIARITQWSRPARVATAVAILALAAGGVAVAADVTGVIGPAEHLTANGHLLHPAGRLTTVGDFPTGSAVAPGGRVVWVVDCGHGEDDVKVVNIAGGQVVQTLPLPGCYGGVTFTPDGLHAYVSGTPTGSSPTEGPVKGGEGDVIHVFTVNPATGTGTEQTPLTLPSTSGGSARTNSLPPVSGVGTAQPEGMAVSPDGSHLVVALNGADDADVVDLRSNAQTIVSVGRYPAGVAFDPQGRAYVSNEYDGTVSVINPTTAKVTATISGLGGSLGDLNSHPEGMIADPDRPDLYVAVTNRDLVAVIDTQTEKVTRLIDVGRSQGVGTAPTALAISPDDGTLYSSDAGEDAVAAVSLSQRPAVASNAKARRVFTAPSVSSITSYHAKQAAAARTLARARRNRAAARRHYAATVRKLTKQYLFARVEDLCAGPTQGQEHTYVQAVLRAVSGPRSQRAAQLGRAKAQLPAAAPCFAPREAFNPPSLKTIGVYHSQQVAAARVLARTRRHRAAARKRYAAKLRSLATKYLTPREQLFCAGATRAQERAYVTAVLRALQGPAAQRASAIAIAQHALPAPRVCGAGRRVYAPPSVTSIRTDRSKVAAAARTLARARRNRTAARRRYQARVRALSARYLSARISILCAGPTRGQEQQFVKAVQRALAGPAGQQAAAIARAKLALPASARCSTGYVAGLPAYSLIGRIPTAAYPDSVQTTTQGQLIWVAGKGFGSGPNPTYYFGGAKTPYQTPANAYGTYVLDLLIGRVGTLALPTDLQVVADTPTADAQSRPTAAESQPAGSPIPAVTGQASTQIKHVFYIVRENRTYDQIFGSDARGDGNANLELFDDNGVSGATGGITPNAHALSRQFPLLDHFYEDSEVSVDGHLITAGAYATDYVQKATAANYSSRRATDDFGIYPVTFPPRFFVFDQAAKQGISFRDYGEAVGAIPMGAAPNRPEYPTVQANYDAAYPNNVFIGCLRAGVTASCTQDSGIYGTTGTRFAGQSRFDVWYPEFEAQVAAGTVPAFNYMILPNDHTNGTTTGDPTPQAFIADNDLALGQIVDAISHSSIWPSTAIFVQEDDSQDGADHVDSHRSPALVISPWARHGAVVHTRYDQYSMLRTAELILGMDPLALNDALATPMYDAFISGGEKPDDSPYNVTSPTYPLTSTNASSSPLSALSDELPFNRLDAVPQAISDQVLWASVHGAHSKPPPAGPDASPDEVDRAAIVRTMLRRNPNVFRTTAGRKAHGRATCPITWACRADPSGDG